MRLPLMLVLCAATYVGAYAQTAPDAAPANPAAAPADPTAKEAPAPETLRIRGLVESVDSGSVSLQLSQGISVKVDLSESTPLFVASAMDQKELALGARLRVRTRTGAQGANIAVEVMAMSEQEASAAEADALPELTFQGSLKAQEEAADERTLVLSEKGFDRRVTLGPETTFWRLRQASLAELKPGMSLSVTMLRGPAGEARPQRAVFGASVAGAQLPL